MPKRMNNRNVRVENIKAAMQTAVDHAVDKPIESLMAVRSACNHAQSSLATYIPTRALDNPSARLVEQLSLCYGALAGDTEKALASEPNAAQAIQSVKWLAEILRSDIRFSRQMELLWHGTDIKDAVAGTAIAAGAIGGTALPTILAGTLTLQPEIILLGLGIGALPVISSTYDRVHNFFQARGDRIATDNILLDASKQSSLVDRMLIESGKTNQLGEARESFTRTENALRLLSRNSQMEDFRQTVGSAMAMGE
jgi:hypothetical protein